MCRRLLFGLWTVLAVSCVHALTISEAPGSSYEPCSDTELAPVSTKLAVDANACSLKTTYIFGGRALPTPTERKELCACKPLISKLQTVTLPHCGFYLSTPDASIAPAGFYSYKALVEYSFGCTSSTISTTPIGTLTPTTTAAPTLTPAPTAAPTPPTIITVPTLAPAPTVAPTPPTFISATPVPTQTTSPPPTQSPSITRDQSAANPTTNASSNESDSNSQVGLILALVGGLVVVITVAVLAFKYGQWRRAAAKRESDHADGDGDDVIRAMPLSPMGDYRAVTSSSPPMHSSRTGKTVARANSMPRTTGSSTSGRSRSTNSARRTARPTEMAMWDDPVLLAVRVPYDAVFFGPLLSRGGYGEVYKGSYRGETVAIKQLLPARRKDLNEIDTFLSEVKLMSTLEHERIIRFIGVAWNALSDACVITEYMENGFDVDKVKIALHVAHALTYLHSLQPVVVHRDLKSKNILLDASYDAKLTDFGVSRERADSTMTAAVGTSLWMAPEVMLGERYDEKADIFSFGIVLSELDSQKLPYDHVKATTSTGRKLPDSAILQMVSLGRLQINFSQNAHPDLVQLGRDCVQLDAKTRPTSAQVLHRVHQVLSSSF